MGVINPQVHSFNVGFATTFAVSINKSNKLRTFTHACVMNHTSVLIQLWHQAQQTQQTPSKLYFSKVT